MTLTQITEKGIKDGEIIDVDIDTNAAIAQSKLALSITDAQLNVNAGIAKSKIETFVNTNADNRVITGSGTANTLNGESNLTFDGSTLAISGTTSILNSSGNTMLELQRTDANTTGAHGTINFTASDGHSVASIGTLGDGDNEGANLVFRTTSAAASNDPFNAATPVVMRLTSDGKLGINCTPSRHLHVNSGTSDIVAVFESTDTSAQIQIKDSTGTCSIECLNDFRFVNSTHEILRLKSDKNVQIMDGDLIIPSTHGINFSAYATSGNPSSNLLDDYEEGTFTAALSSGETCTSSVTSYTKIGRLVTIYAYVSNFSDFNGNTAEFRITGLPFSAKSVSSYLGGGSITYASDFNYSYPLLLLVSGSNDHIYFHRQDGSFTSWQYQDFHNTGVSAGDSLIVQATYETD